MNISDDLPYCTNYFRFMEGVKGGKYVMGAMRMRCKRWSCPHCAKEKAYKIAKRCEEGFQKGQTRFLTLTMRPMKDKVQALKIIKKAWNRLRLKISRKVGSFKYCWTLEAQPGTGMPHLHVLLDKYVNWLWLKTVVEVCGFGPIFDIRAVKSDAVLKYVVKYTTKGLGSEALEQALISIRGRRVGFSRFMSASEEAKAVWLVHAVEENMMDLGVRKLELERALVNAGFKGQKVEISKHSIFADFGQGFLTAKQWELFVEFAAAEKSYMKERRKQLGDRLSRFDESIEPVARVKPFTTPFNVLYEVFTNEHK